MKSEIRNPKFEMPKSGRYIFSFLISDLGFVSDFGFRIWNS
jgi:hypothetical protein